MNIVKKILSGILLTTFFYAVSSQELIWIEAEHFDSHGGWTSDWQFIDQMGSPYLMSIGLGTPVEDAHARIEVEKPGLYRLWARTKDWIPEYHPGRFQININGQNESKTFGATGEKGWIWEDGGVFQFSDETTLTLHDLTGYYGRCDAIILCQDLKWVPPLDKEKIADLRKKYGGVSPEIYDEDKYDVVVIGGGVAGTFAAVSSARNGARTALIQDRGVLGGNTSPEIIVSPHGAQRAQLNLSPEDIKYDPCETGLIEEINENVDGDFIEGGKHWSPRLKKMAMAEPNLDLYLNTCATEVEMKKEDEISSIICLEVPTSKRLRLKGDLFIDCTGNGIIGIKAGAEYMAGKESKDMYNETKAPESADNTTLPSTLKYWFLPQKEEQPFTAPPWIYSFPQCSDFKFKNRHPSIKNDIGSQWSIELGGTDNTFEDAEEIRDDLLRLIYGLWDHIKNHCTDPSNSNASKMKLAWVGHVVGLRESYRLVGDYVMREKDVVEQRLLDDRIAYGGWGLDDHPSLGFFDNSALNHYTHKGILYSIPYRSLYSKNINNLMMAGRDISVTHVALTGTRVMRTTGVIGHAAGTAAGMCIEKQTTPRGIYQKYLMELQQQLLKEGAYLIEIPNMDVNDLVLNAQISASSELAPAREAVNGYSRARLPITTPYHDKNLNAWVPDCNEEKEHWLQLSWEKPQAFNVVHVVFQNRGEMAPNNFRLEVKEGDEWRDLLKAENPKHFRRLVLAVGNIKTKDLRIVLDKKDCLGICEIRVYNEKPETIEMVKRINKTLNEPDEKVLLPWEK